MREKEENNRREEKFIKEQSYMAGKSFYIMQRVSGSKQFFIYRSFN